MSPAGTWRLALFLVGISTLLAVAEYLFDFSGLGVGYGAAFFFLWLAGLFRLHMRGLLQESTVIALVGPIVLALPLVMGELSAVIDLNLSRTYSVTLLEEANRVEKQAVLLRVLDRGFLLYVRSSGQIIFAKNEQVLSISGSPVRDEPTRACRWFGWNWACALRPF